MEKEYRFRLTAPLYKQAIRRSAQRYVTLSGLRPVNIAAYLLFLAAFFAALVHSTVLEAPGLGTEGARFSLSLLAAMVLGIAYSLSVNLAVLRGVIRANEIIGADLYLHLSEGGIRTGRAGYETTLEWSAVRAVEAAPGYALLHLDNAGTIQVPDSAFAGAEEKDDFVAEVETRRVRGAHAIVQTVKTETAPQAAAPIDSPAPPPNFWADLQDNMRAGLRLALFLRVSPSEVVPTWSQLAALTAFQLIIMLFCDLCAAQFQGAPNIFGLPGAVFGIGLTWIAAWALATLSGRSDRTMVLLVAFAALAVPLELVFQLFAHALWHILPAYRGFGASLVYSVPHYWFALAIGVGAIRLLPMPTLRRLAAVAVAVLVWGVPSANIYRDADIWRAPFDPEQQATFRRNQASPAQEDIFYLQPKLLERQLAELKAGREGAVDLYFIGAAGWANQDVFMREVNSVGKLFEERFGTAGRTVRLINNPKSAADTPIASVTALRTVLQRVASVMNPDEDILFLFLTSHGSEQHRFSLQFWPMNFHELTPVKLKELLDEAGIKRRVLIVSACYSGGFIEPLKDDNSLIITAAAPDRNSFGCSNEADFTYFGKAYFDEALRETHSFIEAFEIAKPRIAQREKQSDYKSSDPRIFVGDAIRAPLAQLEQDLRASAVPREKTARQQAKSDLYTVLTEISVPAETVRVYREECVRSMAKVSPARYVEKDRNYYGGLTPDSAHWPRLMAAWSEYAEDYCTAVNDPRIYRRIYERALRDALDARTANAALQFLRTPDGRRYQEASTIVSAQFSSMLIAETTAATDRATGRLMEQQARIGADFQKAQQAVKR
jgi:hypothetical protein